VVHKAELEDQQLMGVSVIQIRENGHAAELKIHWRRIVFSLNGGKPATCRLQFKLLTLFGFLGFNCKIVFDSSQF